MLRLILQLSLHNLNPTGRPFLIIAFLINHCRPNRFDLLAVFKNKACESGGSFFRWPSCLKIVLYSTK